MSPIRPEDVSLIVIAKAPLPGFAKTRLIPDLGPEGAAGVAAAALADTLWAVAETPAARRVLVLDGEADGADWLPAVDGRGFEVIPQREGGLGERLAGAFADSDAAPALLVGMDTPQITASLLEAAIARLCEDGVDAVLGPASDGGYWAIGLREHQPVGLRRRPDERRRHRRAPAAEAGGARPPGRRARAAPRHRHASTTPTRWPRSCRGRGWRRRSGGSREAGAAQRWR